MSRSGRLPPGTVATRYGGGRICIGSAERGVCVADGEPLVRLRSVSREYGRVVALAACDLDVYAGQVTIVAGPNGAGKTTLLQLVAGAMEPTSGTVWIEDLDAASVDGRRRLREVVAHVGDLPVLYPELTVQDHLELVAVAFGVRGGRERAEALLDALDLHERRRFLPHELSAGMRQKLQLAAAFIRPSGLMLFDEPTRALDRASRAALWELIAQSREEGVGVVVITHDEMVPERIGERGLVIDGGKIVADGSIKVALDYLRSDRGGAADDEGVSSSSGPGI